jgi:hypothetical protein
VKPWLTALLLSGATPVWRNGDDFQPFAATEFDNFKKLVVDNGRQEC